MKREAGIAMMLGMLIAPGAAYAGPAAEQCGDLGAHLRDCRPYSCELDRRLSSDSTETAHARYEVGASKGEERCVYRVEMAGEELLVCRLNLESRRIVARIAEMQLDGSFSENRSKLLEAMNSGDPETGQPDPDLLRRVDPEFMRLNKAFAGILAGECG